MGVPNLPSKIEKIYHDWKKLSPSNRLKVTDGKRTGFVSAVGISHVFVKWLPFYNGSYVSTESEKRTPDSFSVVGTMYFVKRNKKKDDFLTF